MSILAIRNYKHDKSTFTEKDFSDIGILILVLNEVLTGEADITGEGKKFLEQYGYQKLSAEISVAGGLIELEDGKNTLLILAALKNLVPMESKNFINDSKRL